MYIPIRPSSACRCRVLVLFAFILSVICFPASASIDDKSASTLPLDASRLVHGPVKPVMWFLEDPAGSIQPEDLISEGSEFVFSQAPEGFNGGFTNSVYWFQFSLRMNPGVAGNDQMELYLEFEYPHIDKLDVFQIERGKIIRQWQLGDLQKFSERPVDAHEFVIPVRVVQDTDTRFIIRSESTNIMQMPLNVWNKERFLQVYGDMNLVNGLFFGLVLIMAIYNLSIGIMLRDQTFILYFCYFATFGLFVFSYFGFGFKFLWPDFPGINAYAMPMLAFIMQAFGLMFSRSFLDTKNRHPWVNRVLLAAIFFCIVMLPLVFFLSYQAITTISISSGLFVAILVNAAGIVSLIKGRRHARFYVIGWSSVMVGWVVFNLAQKDILPLNFFTLHAVQVGAILEVFFLSLALGDQINKVTEEKNLLQARAKAALQEKNTELQALLEKVRESNDLKDQFLATISHELRTPMNGIQGSLELLADIVHDQDAQMPLDNASLSARSMTRLLESLLEFSELQSGKLDVLAKPFQLRKIVANASSESEAIAGEKGLDFNVSIKPTENACLMGDGEKIQHLLFQLVDNAVKFTGTGSVNVVIELIQSRDASELTLEVTDTGKGMDERELAIVFDSFRQLDGSFSRSFGGLGIGLTLVKALVDKLKGDIAISSSPGVGTKVSVSLPVGVVAEEKPASGVGSVQAGKKVLIVEDNPVNQMTLRALVTKLGFEVDTANDGAEAVDLAKQKQFDCILMDCQMPVMDGFTATAAIREGAAGNMKTPILAVTANVMTDDVQRCYTVGMNDVIKKPVSKAIITDKLNQWIGASLNSESIS